MAGPRTSPGSLCPPAHTSPPCLSALHPTVGPGRVPLPHQGARLPQQGLAAEAGVSRLQLGSPSCAGGAGGPVRGWTGILASRALSLSIRGWGVFHRHCGGKSVLLHKQGPSHLQGGSPLPSLSAESPGILHPTSTDHCTSRSRLP